MPRLPVFAALAAALAVHAWAKPIPAIDATGTDPVGAPPSILQQPADAVVARLALHSPSPAELTYEPLGPSSRRTGIVLSEIHRDPVPRPDGRHVPFVELYNSNPFLEDLSGWRLSGDFDFTFPSNTLLPGQSFLVVAPSPDDLRASGITNVVGGFAPPLGAPGFVRLRKRSGAVLLEVPLTETPAWPAAAFGTGHSLVLARPSFGERHPHAWAASSQIGGSPGRPDPLPSGPLETVVLNEFLAHADASDPERSADFVELLNLGRTPVDLSDCVLREEFSGTVLRLPHGTRLDPGGTATFSDPKFDLPSAGGRLAFVGPDPSRVVDAVRYSAQSRGVSRGRYPNRGPEWYPLIRPTPARANAPPTHPQVVINEILYHPPDDDREGEFIELLNPTDTPVTLGGWRFTAGVDFEFPSDASIPPDGYVVVTANAAAFRARHPDLDPRLVFGGWRGSLANDGERIVLARSDGVDVDEVTYADGGRWGRWADGGGSSLERLDPYADGRLAPNWGDSDETRRAPWTTIESTDVLRLAHPGVPRADQLQVMLLGAGEALIDDVEVLVNGANRVINGTFEVGVAGWTFQGTHRLSRHAPREGVDGSSALRLVASDRGDHVANRARTVLSTSIPSGTTATLRARVRWLRGHPEILLRLRNGALEAAGRLQLPPSPGTPGALNSRALPNAAPAILDVQHRPVLPAPLEPVRVTTRVTDPDGIQRVILRYRIDPSRIETGVTMVDDGSGPDDLADDGIFTASIPGQPAGSLVAFRIVAQDDGRNDSPAGALATFPGLSLDDACLVRFGESVVPGPFGNYRVWLLKADHDRWAAREKMSNEDVPATWVYGTHRVIYRAGIHYSGSSYTAPGYTSPTGALCGYDLTLPDDDVFLGDTRKILDWPIRDATNQREQLMYWFLDQLGLPNFHRRYVHLFVNGVRRGTIYDDTQQPGRDTLSEWFSDDDEGSLWKTDCWNEFDDGGNRVDPCILNTLQRFPSSGPLQPARYRWNWRPRAVRGSANDFTDLFALVHAVNTADRYEATVEALVDVDHWMRTFAMNDLASFWDAFGNPNAKNTFLYKPQRDSWKLLSWDFDVGLGVFNDPPNAPLFDVNDPTLARMYRTPSFVRRYWAAIEESLDTFFRTGQGSRLDALLDAKFAAFQSARVALSAPTGIKSWIAQRRTYLLSQLASVRAPFAIATRGGADFTTNRESLTLTGTAPVAVRFLSINEVEASVHWTTVSNWSVTILLRPGTNPLRIRGFDRLRAPIADATDTVTVQFNGTPSALPALRFNEWMASNRSAFADPADGDFDDWFELVNAGVSAVDLTGFTLSDTPADPRRFVIPPGFVLEPGALLLVWADGEPGQTRFGNTLHVSFRLNRDGSALVLSNPLGRIVDSIQFGPQSWDVSEGRWGDGGPGPFFRFDTATPGTPNATPTPSIVDMELAGAWEAGSGALMLEWTALAQRRYVVEFRDHTASDARWFALSDPISVPAGRVSYRDRPPAGTRERYYRVRMLPQ